MYRNSLSEYDELGNDPRQIEPPKSLTDDEMFDLLHLNASRGIGCPQERPDFSIDERYHTEPSLNLPQNPHSSSFGREIPRSNFPVDHFMKDIIFGGIDSKIYGSALPQMDSVKGDDTVCSHGELKSPGFCPSQASCSHPGFTATNSTLISPAIREPSTQNTSTRLCSPDKVDVPLSCGFDEVWNTINSLSNAEIGVQLGTTRATTHQNRDSIASCAHPHTKTHVGIRHDHQASKDTIDLAFTEMLNKHPSARESFRVTTSSQLVAPVPTTSGERKFVPHFNPLHSSTTNHTSSHSPSTYGHEFPGSEANLPKEYQHGKVCNPIHSLVAGSGTSEPVTQPRGNALLLGSSFHGLPQLNSNYHRTTSQKRMSESASLPQIRNPESNFWLPRSYTTKSSASAPQPHSHQKTNISNVPQIIIHESKENLPKSIKFLEDEMTVISKKINQLKVNGKSLIEEKNKLFYENQELQSEKKYLKAVILELDRLLKFMEGEVARLENSYNSSEEEMTRITLKSKELKFENQFLKASANTLEGLVRKMEVEIASQAGQLAIHQIALVQKSQDSVFKTSCIVCSKSIVSTTWNLNKNSPECPECFLTRLSGKAPGWELFQTLDPLCEYLKKQYEAICPTKSTDLSNAIVFESAMLKSDSGSASSSSIGDLVDSLQNLLNVAENFNGGPIDNLVKSMASVLFIQNLFSGSNSLKDQHLTSDFDIMNCVRQGLKHAKKNQQVFSQSCIIQSSLQQSASQELLELDLDDKPKQNDLSESSGHSMYAECFYNFEKLPQESDEKVLPPLLSSGMFGEKLSKIQKSIFCVSGDLSSADQNWKNFTPVKDHKACSLSQSVIEEASQVDAEALKEVDDFKMFLDCIDGSYPKKKDATVELEDAFKSASDFYTFDDARVVEFLRTFKTLAPTDYVDVDPPKIRTRGTLCDGLTGAGKKKVSMTVESVPTSPIIAATKSYGGPGILEQEELFHCSPNIVELSLLRNVQGSKTRDDLAIGKLNSGASVAGSSTTEKGNFNVVAGPSAANHRGDHVCKLDINQPGLHVSDDITTPTEELIEKPKAQETKIRRLNDELLETKIESKDVFEMISDDLIPGVAVEKTMAEVLVESTSSISSRRSSGSDDSWETL